MGQDSSACHECFGLHASRLSCMRTLSYGSFSRCYCVPCIPEFINFGKGFRVERRRYCVRRGSKHSSWGHLQALQGHLPESCSGHLFCLCQACPCVTEVSCHGRLPRLGCLRSRADMEAGLKRPTCRRMISLGDHEPYMIPCMHAGSKCIGQLSVCWDQMAHGSRGLGTVLQP